MQLEMFSSVFTCAAESCGGIFWSRLAWSAYIIWSLSIKWYGFSKSKAMRKVEHAETFFNLSLSTGRCNDVVPARQIGKAAVLWAEIYAVRSSRASKGKTLQKRNHKEENLHASKGLSNTRPLSWEITTANQWEWECLLQNHSKLYVLIYNWLLKH